MLRLLRATSFPQLRENLGRTLLVVNGIAVGVALVVAIGIVNASVLASFRATIAAIAGPADLQVVLGLGEVGFAEEYAAVVRDDPEVAAAVPLVRGTVALADDPAEALQLFGVDLLAEEELRRYRVALVTERRFAEDAAVDLRAVFIAETFAQEKGLAVGDALALSTPRGVERTTIRGLLRAEGMAGAYGGRIVVMDIVAAQDLLGRDRMVDQIDVTVSAGARIDEVRDRLGSQLPAVLDVERPEQHGFRYERVLASFQAMLSGLSALCLVAGFFLIYNTTSTAALRRSEAVAALRLIGAERRQILRLLVVEAALLGIAGSIAGIVIGIALAWLLSGTIAESMGVIFQLRFTAEALAIRGGALVFAALLGIVTAIGASWFAARRIAGTEALAALRAGAEATMPRHSRRSFFLWWLGLVAASLACFFFEERWKSIAWGNLGSTIWNASVVVVAIPVMDALSNRIARVLPRWFGAEGQVAAGSLVHAEARSGVTVAAIALIVTIATLLSSLVLSCQESLASYFAGFLASDLTVSAVSTEGGWLETPLHRDVETELAAIPGVATVATARVLAGQPYGKDRVAILALSPSLFDPARAPRGWYRQGDAVSAEPALRAGRAVTVSESFSERFGVSFGDDVTLTSPAGAVTLPVAGVVPDYVSDRGSVIMSRDVLSEHWGESAANRFLVTVSDTATIDDVRERIRAGIGTRHRLKILSTSELLAYHTDQIDRAFAVMNTVQLLIVIVTVAGVFDLLVSRIYERRRELASWQLVGATKAAVTRSVVIESVVIGSVGALLGIAVGAVTSWLWVRVHFRELLGYYVEFHFAAGAMAWFVALVLAMTALAGFAAARQALKLSVLEGIRSE